MFSKKLSIFTLCIICLFALTMSGFTADKDTEEFVPDATVPLYLNGIKVADGYMFDGTAYTSVRSLTEALDKEADISWDAETSTVDVTDEGLELSATVGDYYICANGRYLLAEDGVILYDDIVIVPVRSLAEVFGAEVEWDEESSSVGIIADGLTMIESGDDFYDETDLYWLSRLINSEAGNQSMLGKIAVGDVVMNRVASDTCPDTVYGVIFDSKYGVQFSVVSTGGIYMEPNEESVIAAKICLEGGNIAGDAIYFVNPDTGSTLWFRTTRTYVGTFGVHDFYA